jgi:hypothetical protein
MVLTRCALPWQLRGGRAALSPLRLERDSGLWVEACHGGQASVDAPLSSLRRVDALYAQRAVADRVENPHGEHAENTWEARPTLAAAYCAPVTLSPSLRCPNARLVLAQLLAQLPPGVLSDLDMPT